MNRFPSSQVLLYLLAIPVWVVAFGCTRGLDGDLLGWLTGFTACTITYVLIAICCFNSIRELFPVGHLVTYMGATLGGLLLDSRLEEMGGMLYTLVPVGGMVIVPTGVVALLAKGAFTRLLGRTEVYSREKNPRRRCFWIALAVGLALLQSAFVIVRFRHGHQVMSLASHLGLSELWGSTIVNYLLALPVAMLGGAGVWAHCRQDALRFSIGGLAVVLGMSAWAVLIVASSPLKYPNDNSLGAALSDVLFWITTMTLLLWYGVRGRLQCLSQKKTTARQSPWQGH